MLPPVAHRRPHEAPHRRLALGKAQRPGVVRRVPQPQRPRHRAEVLEQPRSLAQRQHRRALFGRQAGGDEVQQPPLVVQGRDGAEAGAGQGAGVVHHLLKDGIGVEALVDAQAGLAEAGQPVPHRIVRLVPAGTLGLLHLPSLLSPSPESGSAPEAGCRRAATELSGLRRFYHLELNWHNTGSHEGSIITPMAHQPAYNALVEKHEQCGWI